MKKLHSALQSALPIALSVVMMFTMIACTPQDAEEVSGDNGTSQSDGADLPEGKSELSDGEAPGDSEKGESTGAKGDTPTSQKVIADAKNVAAYSGKAYVAVNNNNPNFGKSDYTVKSFETYGSLDRLGRCTTAYACIGKDLMPTGERGSIGQVKPSGWHTVKYDVVDGKYLYNRCHLIGWQLTAENANTRNLITGTRYLNVKGMLPFENMVADYIKETGNHVLYRVTPDFRGNELVARGVQIEAFSVEDNGDGICFNVYCYNVQPGVTIDYPTGDSCLRGTGFGSTSAANKAPSTARVTTTQSAVTTTKKPPVTTTAANSEVRYIGNRNTKKFHYPGCSSVNRMNEENKVPFYGSRDELINQGYSPCGNCNP